MGRQIKAFTNNTDSSTWYDLDNAAKIFPAISDERNTNVFRIFCELNENIDKDSLQHAVDIAIKKFPHFCVVMRRGLFWYYLEHTELLPKVTLENRRPCSRLFYLGSKELMFEVSYYRKRINLEVFHCVSDGSGAFLLLRAIVYHYLLITHKDELTQISPLDDEGTPSQKAMDSFLHHYNPSDKQTPKNIRAYTIGGTLLPKSGINIIQAQVSTKEMLALAKANGATVTAYLCTLLICSIYSELMPKKELCKPIGVTLPVDLRGHFASHSSRNFFAVVDIVYNFEGQPAVFDQVLQSVISQMKEKITKQNLARRMNYTISMQKNIIARFIPLFIKNHILRIAYHSGETSTTCAFSNLGRITMPEFLGGFIRSFSVILNPTPIHRLKLSAGSFGDAFVLAFTSCIGETGAQKYFFRHLSEKGISVCITCNGGDDDEIL